MRAALWAFHPHVNSRYAATIPAAQLTLWNGCDPCARGLAIHYNSQKTPDGGWVMDNIGNIFPFGGAPTLSMPPRGGGYSFQRLHIDDGGGYALGNFGPIFQVDTRHSLTPLWTGIQDGGAYDIMRDLVLVDPVNQTMATFTSSFGPTKEPLTPDALNAWYYWNNSMNGGVQLDGYGGLHETGANLLFNYTGYPTWSNWDIARDIALRHDRSGGWTLNGYGGISAWGTAPASAGTYNSGVDSFRAMVMTSYDINGVADGRQGYALEGSGVIHAWGGVPALANAPATPNGDAYRGLIITYGANGIPNGATVLDKWGGRVKVTTGLAVSVGMSSASYGDHFHDTSITPTGGFITAGQYGIQCNAGSYNFNWANWADWGNTNLAAGSQVMHASGTSRAYVAIGATALSGSTQPYSAAALAAFQAAGTCYEQKFAGYLVGGAPYFTQDSNTVANATTGGGLDAPYTFLYGQYWYQIMRGQGNTIVVRSSVTGWAALGNPSIGCTSTPGVAIVGTTLYIVCVGLDNHMYLQSTGMPGGGALPVLPAVASAGGTFDGSSPVVGYVPNQGMYIYAVAGGQIWGEQWGSGGAGWVNMGWGANARPGFANYGSGNTRAFIVGHQGNSLWCTTDTGPGWSAITYIRQADTTLQGGLGAAGTSSQGVLVPFVSNGTLYWEGTDPSCQQEGTYSWQPAGIATIDANGANGQGPN